VSRARLGAVVAVAAVLAACASPEATRMRGGGRGADVRNVGDVVRMHEGSDPFWRTPTLQPGGAPSLDSARQAASRSR
jgi:hypothetical protein